MTSGSLGNYYRDEVNDNVNENNVAGNYRIHSKKPTTSTSFEYRAKIIGSKPVDNSRLDIGLVVPLKFLSNFSRSINLACFVMINKFYGI